MARCVARRIRACHARTPARGFHRRRLRRRAARPRRAGRARPRMARGPDRSPGLSTDRLPRARRRCARWREKAKSVGALAVLPRTDFEHADLCGALRTALARRRNVLSETSRAALEQNPPDRFGSVRIRGHRCLRRLAVGGSSSVFLAENVRTGEQRVLKIFRQVPDVVEGSTTFDRFLREFELVAHLRHPNIARIFDIGVADDHLYLAMEFFPGGDLRSRMRERLEPRAGAGLCAADGGGARRVARSGRAASRREAGQPAAARGRHARRSSISASRASCAWKATSPASAPSSARRTT